jgi:hypothetical protein
VCDAQLHGGGGGEGGAKAKGGEKT